MALKMNLEISKDSQKTRVLDESTPEEKTFLEKHGAFLGNLSDIAGIPKNRFLALIERETSFRPNNNGKGSFGYGQLTKIIFEDMKYVIPLGKEKNTTGRGEKYANLFLRCAEGNDITGVVTSLNNLEAKNAMERLLSCMKDGKINPKQKGLYNQTIQELARLARKDDQINLLFSAILHGRMHADISQAVEKANSWIPKAREAMER